MEVAKRPGLRRRDEDKGVIGFDDVLPTAFVEESEDPAAYVDPPNRADKGDTLPGTGTGRFFGRRRMRSRRTRSRRADEGWKQGQCCEHGGGDHERQRRRRRRRR